ncbi:MAG TPA: tRNA (guanosine(46)-N7)-methyltransferase TrmB, partial [Urbifossiella sp.]|nr:tRNA (guanosine(46)-N7)-methyltransferase TrmB [Urbifossiella sp.]
MRKPRRLSPEEIAPYEWHPPRRFGRWGVGQVGGSTPGSSSHLPPPPFHLDWPALFGNPNPVEVEVGM